MKKITTKDIVDISIVCAIYIVLTIFNPLSYSFIQLRISEALILLVFFNKKYSVSIILGVLVSNFFNSEFMLLDIIFGTISTIIACILISRTKSLFIASLCPILTSLLVGLEIYIYSGIDLWMTILYIIISMFIVEVVIGYPIFKMLSKNKTFLKLMDRKEESSNEI